VIKTFADGWTKEVFETGRTGGDPPAAPTMRKFDMLDIAALLGDLAAIPGNNFEKYKDHRKGQYSIRINQKYRLFFQWSEGHAYEVRLSNEH
jgi:proteic killer suppression protein